MKAVTYARFSTDRQNESSIADQMRICDEYAEREGMTIVARYKDEGISGASFGNRPAFKKMRAAALEGQFDALLVTDTTRLSRSQELAPLVDLLRFQQVRVIGSQDNFDSSAGTADMQAGLSGLMSVEFRKMVKARTHAALESRAKAHRSAGGKCYGYKSVRGRRELKGTFDGAAQDVLRGNSSLRKLYDQLRAKGLDHKKAKKAVSRKIASICLSIMKNGTQFDDHYEEKQRRLLKKKNST